MTDFHHNIFYYYRGPRQCQNVSYDPQLENNTTKSLVNTLKHCDPAVAIKFLEWLDIKTTSGVELELQKADIGKERIRRTSQRLLLGLVVVPGKQQESISCKLEGPTTGDSRPDAWLYGEDFVVLIESKVGDAQLDLHQMRGHFGKLRADAPTKPRFEVRTWADVHQFFSSCLPSLGGKDNWLVKQFTQYLEWKGMSEFSGFDGWMFEFLVRDDQDAEEKKLIRRTMERFGDRILHDRNGLKHLDSITYEKAHVGNFSSGDDHFWLAFGPEKFRERCHQTISLYDDRLDVFVNVELRPAVNLLRRRIVAQEWTFKNKVAAIPGPFTVRIEERRKRGEQPRAFDYYGIAELEGGDFMEGQGGHYGLKDPASDGFNYLLGLLKHTPFPYLSVRRRIDRKRVLELSGGDARALVDEVVRIMKEFHPLVDFINTGRT